MFQPNVGYVVPLDLYSKIQCSNPGKQEPWLYSVICTNLRLWKRMYFWWFSNNICFCFFFFFRITSGPLSGLIGRYDFTTWRVSLIFCSSPFLVITLCMCISCLKSAFFIYIWTKWYIFVVLLFNLKYVLTWQITEVHLFLNPKSLMDWTNLSYSFMVWPAARLHHPCLRCWEHILHVQVIVLLNIIGPLKQQLGDELAQNQEVHLEHNRTLRGHHCVLHLLEERLSNVALSFQFVVAGCMFTQLYLAIHICYRQKKTLLYGSGCWGGVFCCSGVVWWL